MRNVARRLKPSRNVGTSGAAIEKLSGAVTEYRNYVLELRNKKDSCVCPEFLHIVGFSDGATTIAKAIKESGSAIELPKDTIGLVGLVDLVRYDELIPNARDDKKLYVATIGPSCSSSHAIRSTKGGWRGYQILSDWKETRVATNHFGIPKHGLTKEALVGGMGESMRKLLKANKCRSLLEFRLF